MNRTPAGAAVVPYPKAAMAGGKLVMGGRKIAG